MGRTRKEWNKKGRKIREGQLRRRESRKEGHKEEMWRKIIRKEKRNKEGKKRRDAQKL